jgi:hypothetical protein
MVIIKTKYLNPTNTRGSRITAEANGWKVSIPYPHELSGEMVHYEAVKALIEKHQLDWDISNMGYGSDNQGYYFTFSSSILSD